MVIVILQGQTSNSQTHFDRWDLVSFSLKTIRPRTSRWYLLVEVFITLVWNILWEATSHDHLIEAMQFQHLILLVFIINEKHIYKHENKNNSHPK